MTIDLIGLVAQSVNTEGPTGCLLFPGTIQPWAYYRPYCDFSKIYGQYIKSKFEVRDHYLFKSNYLEGADGVYSDH